jgi:L-aminopeptidase/D-esterase-like protein
MIPNDSMDPLFEATAMATEEAIINALVAARQLTVNAVTIPRTQSQM